MFFFLCEVILFCCVLLFVVISWSKHTSRWQEVNMWILFIWTRQNSVDFLPSSHKSSLDVINWVISYMWIILFLFSSFCQSNCWEHWFWRKEMGAGFQPVCKRQWQRVQHRKDKQMLRKPWRISTLEFDNTWSGHTRDLQHLDVWRLPVYVPGERSFAEKESKGLSELFYYL